MATTATPDGVPSKPIIRWLGKSYYRVSSRTTPGQWHEIDTFRLTCTCTAGQYGRRCHALALAIQYEAWRRNEQAKAHAQATAPQAQASQGDSDDHATHCGL
jgi:hypothetical protein